MTSEKQCPKCGSPMVIKTARRGFNAGNNFYSCSRFPDCRGTRDIDDQNGKESKKIKSSDDKNSLPYHLVARSKYSGYQALFFENISTTLELLEVVLIDEEEKPYARAFSQWRLDFPKSISFPEWTEKENQTFSVCEKILSRGCITLCSPNVEKKLSKIFNINKEDINKIKMSKLLCSFPIAQDYWLDSEAESIFLYELLPKVFGDSFAQWVLPQVEISSLLPGNAGETIHGRVDFLISHPSQKKSIVVEIDGEQHNDNIRSDRLRDEGLIRSGFEVFRIPAKEVVLRSDQCIKDLQEMFPKEQANYDSSASIQFIQAIKTIHQLQVTVLHAIRFGFLDLKRSNRWKILFQFPRDSVCNNVYKNELFKLAVDDLLTLFRNLGQLYSIDLCSGKPTISIGDNKSLPKDAICISLTDRIEANHPTFIISNIYVPFQIAYGAFPTSAAKLEPPKEENLLYFLDYLFRKKSFWEGQMDTIQKAFQRKDAILLLPTGGGKSIAFQMASLLLPGRTIVIEPIISLIEDQLDNLASYGIDRCIGITSMINNPQERAEIVNLFSQAEYLLVYIAPERFQTVEFRNAFRSLTLHTPVNIIIIDEAHCVSEWGHDFRTAYLNLGRISRVYCESNGDIPPLIALTGTASKAVLKDVQRELGIDDFDAIITPKSFDRPELKFEVIQCKSSEKFPRLKGYLGHVLPNYFSASRSSFFQTLGKETSSGLVFCPWVNGDFGVVQVSRMIQSELSIPNDFYSGKPPSYEKSVFIWSKRKQLVSKNFKHNRIPLLTCTKAFGMGIDKPNIRYTIHYGLPQSIESFYQEAGRAGRDRGLAYCTIIASNDDPNRTNLLLDPNTPVEKIAEILKETNKDDDDDVTRALYFHTKAFRGIDIELNDIKELIEGKLPNYNKRTNETIVYSKDKERGVIEKGLHRLLILGIVEDYTIDYSKKTFRVISTGATKEEIIQAYGKYVSGYLGSRSSNEVERAKEFINTKHSEFVLRMIRLLLNLIYSVLEQGRRRALYEMYLATINKTSDLNIRQSILNYLEETEHSELIDVLINDENGGFLIVKTIIDDICSLNEAAEIRGQVSRHLEAYPDHPGLLMTRALTEASLNEININVIKQNFIASIKSSIEKYSIEETLLYEFIAWSINHLSKRDHSLSYDLTEEVNELLRNTDLAKTMVNVLPESLAVLPAYFLLDHVNRKCEKILLK